MARRLHWRSTTSGDYTGGYTGDYTRDYTGDYTGDSKGDYPGAHTGDYTTTREEHDEVDSNGAAMAVER